MSKFAKKVAEIMGLPEDPKNEFKGMIKTIMPIMRLLQVIMFGGLFISAVDLIISTVQSDFEEMYSSIFLTIDCAAFAVICTIGCGIIKLFRASETPFVSEVPKRLRAMAFIIMGAFLVSAGVTLVFKAAAGAVPQHDYIGYFANPYGMIFVTLLIMLSYIFDIGCKLQQESDETL